MPKLADNYREAAAKKFGVPLNPFGAVHPMHDGAFVEIQVWIPLEEVVPKVNPCHSGHIWPNQFGEDWTPVDGTPCACGEARYGVKRDG